MKIDVKKLKGHLLYQAQEAPRWRHHDQMTKYRRRAEVAYGASKVQYSSDEKGKTARTGGLTGE